MYTPQRKTHSTLPITPQTERTKPSTPSPTTAVHSPSAYKVSPQVLPPPPVGLLDEGKRAMEIDELNENVDDWQRFKEVGFLDEDGLERRDRQAVIARVEQLQKELHDYQYAMGLLLLEKNEYNAKCDKLGEAVKETQEMIKREQGAHRIGIDELEKREKNLKEALDAEKHSVASLERMLRETCFEYEQVKVTCDNKLSDATALINVMRDKSNDIDEKLYTADVNLAEANSKSLELERKSEEIEYRESSLKRETISVKVEGEAHETSILRNREGLQQWERKLQDGEGRLCEGRRLVNQREEKVKDIEKILNRKEIELEEKRKAVDSACLTSKEKEEKLNDQLVELTLQEEKIASTRRNLEAKERELNRRTEKLRSREIVIQNNIDEYKMDLDLQKRDFESELRIKRKTFDYEIMQKVHDLEHRETEFGHIKEKLQKREQASENKSGKLKAKENEIDDLSELLKEREKSFKTEKKRLESTNKEIIHEKDCLETCKYEIEKLQVDISHKKQLICEETEKLEVMRDEKAEHFRLLMELKQEIGRNRNQWQLQFKEGEILKNDRQKSKEEWKELDEKIADISGEMQKLNNEKEMFEKGRHALEEKLNNEKLATEDLKREYEAIRLEKETLEATMRHEQLVYSERAENSHQQLKHDYETLKRKLETDMLKKKDEMERAMQERQKAFRKEEKTYFNDIDKLKMSIENEREGIKSRKQRLRKEKEEVSSSKKKLEECQSGMQTDIGELLALSNMVKNQRENFISERSEFLSFVERLKSCQSCSVSNHALLDHYVNETNEVKGSLFPIIEDELVDQDTSNRSVSQIDQTQLHKKESRSSGSRSGTSTLLKCVSKLSPINKFQSSESSKLLSEELKPSTSLEMKCDVVIEDGEPSHQMRDDSLADSRMGEIPEPSEQSEQRRYRGKGASKSKKMTSSRSSHEDEIEIKEGSGKGKVTAEKPAGTSTRKRNRGRTSNSTEPDDSKEHSESVTTGGQRKRRNTGTPTHHTPENKRYNLRRKKPVGTISEADAVREGGKTITEEVSVDGGSKVMIPNTRVASVRSMETSSEHYNQTLVAQVRTCRNLEIQEVSSHKVVESTAISDTIDEEAPPKSLVLGMRVDIASTAVHGVEDEHDNTINDNDDSDDDASDGDDMPGEVSVGSKIWTFFTS